jgi:hypothetical protein
MPQQPKSSACDSLNLPSLNLSVKSLFTSYLVATGLGAVLAMAQILMTHGMADGKLGLSIDDIVYSYHGDPKNSKIEIKLNGSMRDKAPAQERMEIIKWVRNGATKEGWDNKIKEIVYKNCISCHSTIPGLPDFTTYSGIKPVTTVKNSGASINLLTRISHIHIFAISFIFFFNGLIFSFAIRIKPAIKIFLISAPFFFLVIDVFSWWLTKIHPGFAWATIVSGMGYGLCSAITWVISLYQMWIIPKKEQNISINTWR